LPPPAASTAVAGLAADVDALVAALAEGADQLAIGRPDPGDLLAAERRIARRPQPPAGFPALAACSGFASVFALRALPRAAASGLCHRGTTGHRHRLDCLRLRTCQRLLGVRLLAGLRLALEEVAGGYCRRQRGTLLDRRAGMLIGRTTTPRRRLRTRRPTRSDCPTRMRFGFSMLFQATSSR
jgi:hypothetical protein